MLFMHRTYNTTTQDTLTYAYAFLFSRSVSLGGLGFSHVGLAGCHIPEALGLSDYLLSALDMLMLNLVA